MNWLNYHHLLYFYSVAKEGSVTAAALKLHLSQPTLSGQVRQLEEALGEKLFERRGRNLVLSEAGQVVYRYADEIFSLGKELTEAVKGRHNQRSPRFVVGAADVLPKLVVYRLLEPAMKLDGGIRLTVREESMERLLAALSAHELDLVLSDSPLPPTAGVKAWSHLLTESTVSFFAVPALAAKLRPGFPATLERQPMLMPGETAALRRPLERWLEQANLRPEISAEIEDSALLKSFGGAGAGVFAAPTVMEAEVCRQYQVEVVGRAEELKERYYAISVERRIRHPAVVAISAAARELTPDAMR
jgi:LysR family transcriptional regulator, transcriptional activator of nhaA